MEYGVNVWAGYLGYHCMHFVRKFGILTDWSGASRIKPQEGEVAAREEEGAKHVHE
jgi:hypothetical protein